MSEGKKRISDLCDYASGTLDGVGIAEKFSAVEISNAEAKIVRAGSVKSELKAIITETFEVARRR